jgi:P4 family phage/plasmid primase-like protien
MNKTYHLAERITECAPVRVDITLAFEEEPDELYDDDFILSLIHCYQQAAHDLFTTTTFGARYCCVLQPEELGTVSGDRFVCYLVLHFPYLRMTPQQHLAILRREAIKNLRTDNTISLLRQQPIGDWEDIIARPSDTLPFYGSTRTPDEPILYLTRIYDWVSKEHILANEGPERELSEVFVPYSHTLVKRGLLEVDGGDRWQPLFFSVDLEDRIATTTIPSPNEEPIQPLEEETELEEAQRFILMLRPERFSEDHTWIDIGKAIYNVCKGEEEGLRYWKKLARQYGRDPEECDRYSEFKVENNLTIKTLAWFAKRDNPQEYTRWHRGYLLDKMEQALNITHTDVARALYHFYWLDYVCTGAKDNTWYHFQNHRWKPDDDATNLKRLISSEFAREFEVLRTTISQEIQDSSDPNFKRGKEEQLKRLNTLIGKLKTVSFKTSLVKECKEWFYHETFPTIADSDPSLLGVNNGVIQLTPKYATFREGKPEDFITRHSLVSYDPTLTPSDPRVKLLNKWFYQMFPDKELLSYALRLFSSCLFGKNSNKIFPVLTGSGDNSKSMLKKLFEATLGPYCVTVPNVLLTGKKNSSSSPTPELAQLMNARIAFVQEPDGDDIIKGGVVKELTGGDSFFARFLHKNGGAVVAMFTLMLLCNKIPTIPNADKAIMNRLRVLPFLSTWCEDAPKTEEEQFRVRKFPKDPNFELKIPKMAPAFLWTLVKEYGNYTTIGLKEPELIKKHTNDYWEQNDPMVLFWRQEIEEAYLPGYEPKELPNPEDPDRPILDKTNARRDLNQYITWKEVYGGFKAWFQNANPGIKAPAMSTSKPEFERRVGPLGRGSKWYGFRFKEHNSELTPLNYGGF